MTNPKRKIIMLQEDMSLCMVYDLVTARRRRGWTQRQLAREMGVSQARVGQMENGHRISVDVLARWAAALDYKVAVDR